MSDQTGQGGLLGLSAGVGGTSCLCSWLLGWEGGTVPEEPWLF